MEQRTRLYKPLSRLDALKVGGTIIGGVAATGLAGCAGGSSASGMTGGGAGTPMVTGAEAQAQLSTVKTGATAMAAGYSGTSFSPNVAESIQKIIQAQGKIDNGVLDISIDREDLNNIKWHGYTILPSFQINGDLVFQCLGGADEVLMNGDFALKSSEIQPFIDELLKHEVTFQAEHQHVYDWEPDVWFIHFRMRGIANGVAQAIKAALNVTSTPFPQTLPKNPTTPLPAEELGDIIGAKPDVGANGVVNFKVPRANPITLGGVQINPYLNVETPIAFQPLGGANAIAVPDYGMIASEIQRVVAYNREHGWESGCLYNQETDEQPQLYFDHFIKVGNALTLAHEIRGALDLMNMKFETP